MKFNTLLRFCLHYYASVTDFYLSCEYVPVPIFLFITGLDISYNIHISTTCGVSYILKLGFTQYIDKVLKQLF